MPLQFQVADGVAVAVVGTLEILGAVSYRCPVGRVFAMGGRGGEVLHVDVCDLQGTGVSVAVVDIIAEVGEVFGGGYDIVVEGVCRRGRLLRFPCHIGVCCDGCYPVVLYFQGVAYGFAGQPVVGGDVGQSAFDGVGTVAVGVGQRHLRIVRVRGYQEEFFYGLYRTVGRYADGGRASVFACTDVFRSDRGVGVVYAEVGR